MIERAIKSGCFRLLCALMLGIAKIGKRKIRISGIGCKGKDKDRKRQRLLSRLSVNPLTEERENGRTEEHLYQESGPRKSGKGFPEEFYLPRIGVWDKWEKMAWSCPDKLRHEASQLV